MKSQTKLSLTTIAVACASFTGALSNAQAQIPNFPKPILACEFKKDCQSCYVIVKKVYETDKDDRFKKKLIVKCDGETVYDGKALIESASIKHNPKFAVSVISAVWDDDKEPNFEKPAFPSVSVDGDVEDNRSFVDRYARLRLSKHDVLLGKCIHFGKHNDDNDDHEGDSDEPDTSSANSNPTP